MNRKYLLTGSFASLGMLILILDGQTALAGARTGIDLCIRTVIPSLFPFFLLSTLLTSTLAGTSLSLLRPLGKLCGIPKGGESILLTGFLGGYPTGAQAITSAYSSKQIRKEDAQRLLCFCNNAGPAFLFGMVAPIFSDPTAPFLLWGIHIASALLVARLIPASETDAVVSSPGKKLSISNAMRTSITVMATVCGWVILFRIVIEFLDRWFLWLLPTTLQVICSGVLELSNGCCELSRIPNPALRFVICSGILAWGGLCVTLQTRSVTDGLSIKSYMKGKFLQTLFSLFLSASVVLNIWLPVAALLLLMALLVQKMQKRGSNPAVVSV